MRKYKHFINENKETELEDEGINKEEKKVSLTFAEEKERLKKIDDHDKEVTKISELTEKSEVD